MNTGAFAKGLLLIAGIFLGVLMLLGFLSGIVGTAIGGTAGGIVASLVTAGVVLFMAAGWPGRKSKGGGRYWIAALLSLGTFIGVYVGQNVGGLLGVLTGGLSAAVADGVLLIVWIFVVPKSEITPADKGSEGAAQK